MRRASVQAYDTVTTANPWLFAYCLFIVILTKLNVQNSLFLIYMLPPLSIRVTFMDHIAWIKEKSIYKIFRESMTSWVGEMSWVCDYSTGKSHGLGGPARTHTRTHTYYYYRLLRRSSRKHKTYPYGAYMHTRQNSSSTQIKTRIVKSMR